MALETKTDALGAAIAVNDAVKLLGTITSIDVADVHAESVLVTLTHPVSGFRTTFKADTKELEKV